MRLDDLETRTSQINFDAFDAKIYRMHCIFDERITGFGRGIGAKADALELRKVKDHL